MTASEPLVSVITPTFNRERTITQAVESVLAQSYPNWELIIIDDGSRDSTREKLAGYLDDSRIQYHFQENQGQSIARNLALHYARGELVCFLDSDDLWVPEKLERQVALMEAHPEVDVLHSDEIMIDEQGRELSRKNMRRYSGRIARQMLVDNSVSINTVMARRKCFDAHGRVFRPLRRCRRLRYLAAFFSPFYVPVCARVLGLLPGDGRSDFQRQETSICR